MKMVRGYEAARALLSERPAMGTASPEVLQRVQTAFPGETTLEGAVKRILDEVRSGGDRALLELTAKTDGIELTSIEVTRDAVDQSVRQLDGELLEALELAAGRVRAFHETQKARLGLAFIENGLGFLVRPIQRVGLYVPGGRASYPSTVLMTAIPARVAGVDEVVMCTPPGPDGKVAAATLAAASLAGVDRVFSIGGAQAIAAMAFGTRTVPRVDKICGPGNVFVTTAKKLVYGTVGIDGLHGPTETLIIADDSASPELCASDLLAQAEHDEMATAILISISPELSEEVSRETERQLKGLKRRSTAGASLERNGLIITVDSAEEAIELANILAPEHLCLVMRDSGKHLERIRNAGGVFVGSPEALGDYVAGPSHVMPTGGTARFSSPISVLDFLKLSVLVDVDDRDGALSRAGALIARAEGLDAHARSLEKRAEAGEKRE